jgi:hypothetical protein
MINEKIIQYAITSTLWVQTLGNQANAPYSSIVFQRYQECNSKQEGFGIFQCHIANQTSLLNNIDRWKKDNICQTIGNNLTTSCYTSNVQNFF